MLRVTVYFKMFLRYGNVEHLDDANAFQSLLGSVICDQGKDNGFMLNYFSEIGCLKKRSYRLNWFQCNQVFAVINQFWINWAFCDYDKPWVILYDSYWIAHIWTKMEDFLGDKIFVKRPSRAWFTSPVSTSVIICLQHLFGLFWIEANLRIIRNLENSSKPIKKMKIRIMDFWNRIMD